MPSQGNAAVRQVKVKPVGYVGLELLPAASNHFVGRGGTSAAGSLYSLQTRNSLKWLPFLAAAPLLLHHHL